MYQTVEAAMKQKTVANKKIQIFLDSDIVIRHFIYSNVFSELEKGNDVQYVFPIDRRVSVDISSLRLRNVATVPVDRSRLAKLTMLAKTQTIKMARKNKELVFIYDAWRYVFGQRGFYKMWLKSLPPIFYFYKKTVIKESGINHDLEHIIDVFDPDIIIHPSVLDGLFISDLAVLSAHKKIPFLVLMNSWDNPSSKAMIVRKPDYLVVWGEETKQHAVKFLGMNPSRVKILGAAQFEVYRQSPTNSKLDLCRILKIKENLKLILYAGSSKSVNEIQHLEILEKAVNDGDLPACHIIFRPHPWRAPAQNEPDFFDIFWKHVSMDPSMKDFYNSNKQAKKNKINLTDYMDTHNLLSAIDLLVCNASTILLEGALHGKPLLCMVTDEEMKTNRFLKTVMKSVFFQELLEKLEIPRCKNYAVLSEVCRGLLELSSLPSFAQKQLQKVQFFVEQGIEPYPRQLRELVNEIIEKGYL